MPVPVAVLLKFTQTGAQPEEVIGPTVTSGKGLIVTVEAASVLKQPVLAFVAVTVYTVETGGCVSGLRSGIC